MSNHFSHSRLDLYETCPRQFKFRYVDRIAEAPSEPLLIGQVVHEIIAEYNSHLLASNLQTDFTALRGIMNRVLYEGPKGPIGSGLPTSRLHEVERIVVEYGESHVFYPGRVVGIEEKLRLPMTVDGHQVNFWAVLDLLEIVGDLAIITDYKTDHQLRSYSATEHDLQLAIYAWAVKQEYPQVNQFQACLDFVRHRVVREVELDPDVTRTEKRIHGLIRQIQRDTAFAPRPGAGCSWCSYIAQCPALATAGCSSVCATPEDAAVIAGDLAVLEARVTALKRALSDWCATRGPVEANGLVWGHSKTTSVTYSPAGFELVLRDAGLEPTKFLRVDATEAKRLLKQRPDLVETLAPYTKDRSYTRFDGRKKGVEAGEDPGTEAA